MKRLTIIVCAAVLSLSAYAVDANSGKKFIFDKDFEKYAKVVDNGNGTATITIVDTNGTAHAVTVYNKGTMDTALAGKATTGDVTALQTRATALEGATNSLNSAVADIGSFIGSHFDEYGNLVSSWTQGTMTLYADKMAFHYSGGGGTSARDWTITFPTSEGTFALASQILSQFPYTAITNAPWLTSYTETDPNVSSWAKAATKPSYNFSEIGSKPTTLSGYGITDAKIQNGTITLGSATITPVTNHQSLAGYVPTSRKVQGKALTSDVTLYGSDIALASGNSTKVNAAITALNTATNNLTTAAAEKVPLANVKVNGTAITSSSVVELGNAYIKYDSATGDAVLWIRQ